MVYSVSVRINKFLVGLGLVMSAAVSIPDTSIAQPRFMLKERQGTVRMGAVFVPKHGLSNPGSKENPQPGVYLAQAADTGNRVLQLEEQVRRLNGQIEELNFMVLQMQEQLRRMQEDNEFRFQELEGGKRSRLEDKDSKPAKKDLTLNSEHEGTIPQLSDHERQVAKLLQNGAKQETELFDGSQKSVDEQLSNQPLGTITYDGNGKIVETAMGKPLDLTERLRPVSQAQPEVIDRQQSELDSIEARINALDTPDALYESAYRRFQLGDYQFSALAFEAFAKRYSDHEKLPQARYWLGESLFSQSKFQDAAEVFLDAHNNWPNHRLAPQMLLKLGISLAGMQQRELACATYAKVSEKYPALTPPFQQRILAEQKSAHCLNG